MGKRKTKTTNTFQHMNVPNTPDMESYRQSLSSYDKPDASIPYLYAKRREKVANRFENPFGHGYSPEVADAFKYNAINDLDQEQGLAVREDNRTRQMAKSAAMAQLAGMTRPELVQTGGTTIEKDTNWIRSLIASGVGAGAEMGQQALL